MTRARKSRPSASTGAAKSFPGDCGQFTQHEASAWMRERVAQVLADAAHLGGIEPHPNITVMLPLGEPARPGTREDRTCDRCGAYVDDDGTFVLVQHCPRPGVLVYGGLCEACALLEVGR